MERYEQLIHKPVVRKINQTFKLHIEWTSQKQYWKYQQKELL